MIRAIDRTVSWTIASLILIGALNDLVRYLNSRRTLSKVAPTMPRTIGELLDP